MPGSPSVSSLFGAEPPLALVTGASTGIGLEFARILARQGFRLVLVANDASRLAAAEAELAPLAKAGLEAIRADLADPAALQELCTRIGPLELDVLVNNAGFGVYGPFSDTDGALEARMIDTNVRALTLIAKAVLPGMMARGQGRMVNVASTAAFAPGPFAAVYAATKAYVLSFSDALAEELADTKVRVTALCPGPTATPFVARAGMGRTRIFRGPITTAEAVAEAGYAAMLAGKRVEVVGGLNRFMAFAVRLMPRALVARVSRRVFEEEGAG